MKIPHRVKDSPATYRVALKHRKNPSLAAKRIGDILIAKGFKRSETDEYAIDNTYEFEHALKNPKGGPGVIYDIVVYGSNYSRCYIELDGPRHDPKRDEEKEQRAKKAKTTLLRFSSYRRNIKQGTHLLADDEIWHAITDALKPIL